MCVTLRESSARLWVGETLRSPAGCSPFFFRNNQRSEDLFYWGVTNHSLRGSDMKAVIWRYLPGPTDPAELVHVPCAPGETAWEAAERYFIEHPDADAALAVVYDVDDETALAAA